MILPESFESELSSYARSRFTQSVHNSSENAGIAQSASNGVFSRANRKQSTVSLPHDSEVDDDDPSLLLEIIRELVEETSEWDPSTVFMNESFKTLLQESGITPTKSARDGFAEAQVANAEKKPDDDRSAGSESVDLELLGLDIFESESLYNARSSKVDNAANLVSFWDEDSGERYVFYFTAFISRAEYHPGAARLSEWRGDTWDPLFSFMVSASQIAMNALFSSRPDSSMIRIHEPISISPACKIAFQTRRIPTIILYHLCIQL
jgi:hypothetical protein